MTSRGINFASLYRWNLKLALRGQERLKSLPSPSLCGQIIHLKMCVPSQYKYRLFLSRTYTDWRPWRKPTSKVTPNHYAFAILYSYNLMHWRNMYYVRHRFILKTEIRLSQHFYIAAIMSIIRQVDWLYYIKHSTVCRDCYNMLLINNLKK